MTSQITFMLVSALLAPASVGAGQNSKPALIPIYVTTAAVEADTAKGFVSAPPPEVLTLRKQITNHYGRIKGDVLTLAATGEAAAIRLEFLDASKQQVAGSHIVSWSASKNEYTVRGTLIVGDLRKDFTASGDALYDALSKMVADVEAFVRDNRDKIRRDLNLVN